MAMASGVIAGAQAVGSIASANSRKRREREAAAQQAYYANAKYQSEKMSIESQKMFADQQVFLSQLQQQGVRLQEDYALAENDIQNLMQAASMKFQIEAQRLQQNTQAEQLSAEGDKTKFQAGQQKRVMDSQALEASQQGQQQIAGELSQVQQAIEKGDFEQAAMLALMAGQGQDSSSVTSSVMNGQADSEQALMAARAAMEAGRFSEIDLQGLLMSKEFSSALERLGIMQGDAQQRQALTNKQFADTQANFNRFNVDREANLSQMSSDAARGILNSQRGLQDLTLSQQSAMNEFVRQQSLTSAEIERGAGVSSANQMSRNARGAGLFDYLNAGYTLYQGASPLFRNNTQNAWTPSYSVDTVNGFSRQTFPSVTTPLRTRGGAEGDFGISNITGLGGF